MKLSHYRVSETAVLSVILFCGSLPCFGVDLAPFPFTKSQFNGQLSLTASQNSGGRAIAARTFIVTQEFKNHSGRFQIDLVTTLERSGDAPPLDAVHADQIATCSFYVSSSVSAYYTMPPSSLNGGELFKIHTSAFVDSFGNPLQTYPTQGGNQFVSTSDLGVNYEDHVNLAFSTLTSESQAAALRSWIGSLEVGDVAVIGISFDANSVDGIMSITSTGEDLGNDVVAFGTSIPEESLGFSLRPVPEKLTLPRVSCAITSTSAELTFSGLIPNREYRVMRTPTLAAWVEAYRFTAAAATNSWSESLATGGKMFYRLEWDE